MVVAWVESAELEVARVEIAELQAARAGEWEEPLVVGAGIHSRPVADGPVLRSMLRS